MNESGKPNNTEQREQYCIISGGEELLPRLEPLWLELKEFHISEFPIWSESLLNGNFSDRVKGLQETTENGAILVELVLSEEKEVAFCISTINQEGAGELASLYVTPPFRKQGLGRRLVESSLQWLREHQAKPITVDVMAGNSAALRLYRHFGFVERVTHMHLIDEKK